MPTGRTSAWGLLGLNQVSLTLTAKEIKGLVGNPITLISHPGPHSYNAILHIAAISNFGTVPFLSPSVSGFVGAQIVYDGPTMWPATASVSNLHNVILGPASAVGNVMNACSGAGISPDQAAYPLTEIVDRNIVIGNFTYVSADTPVDYVQGDGTIKLTLLYATINIS